MRGWTSVDENEWLRDEGTWGFFIWGSSTWKGTWTMTIPFEEGMADLLVPKVETWAGEIGRRDYFGMIDRYLVYYDATS